LQNSEGHVIGGDNQDEGSGSSSEVDEAGETTVCVITSDKANSTVSLFLLLLFSLVSHVPNAFFVYHSLSVGTHEYADWRARNAANLSIDYFVGRSKDKLFRHQVLVGWH
jgi:hypothetical protein